MCPSQMQLTDGPNGHQDTSPQDNRVHEECLPRLTTCWIIKQSPTNFKGFKDIQSTCFDHSKIKLEISKKEKMRRSPKCLEIKRGTSK